MKKLILFLILIFTLQSKSISQFEGIYYEDRFNNDFEPTIDYSDYEYSYFTSRILRFRQGPLLFDFYSPLYVGLFPMYSPFYMNSFWNYNLYNPYLFNHIAFNSSWSYVYFNRFNRWGQWPHWNYWNRWDHWNYLGQNTPFNKNIFVSNTIINNQPPKQFASRNTSVSRINTQSGRRVVQSPRTTRTPVQSNNRIGRVNRPQSTTIRGDLNNSSSQRSYRPTQRQQSTTPQRSYRPTQRQQSTTPQRRVN